MARSICLATHGLEEYSSGPLGVAYGGIVMVTLNGSEVFNASRGSPWANGRHLTFAHLVLLRISRVSVAICWFVYSYTCTFVWLRCTGTAQLGRPAEQVNRK